MRLTDVYFRIYLNSFTQLTTLFPHRLIKSKLVEIQNKITIARNISDDTFRGLDATLNIFNQIWKKREEVRRQKAIEEESLYVNK